MSAATLFAAVALIPAVTGPIGAAGAQSLTLGLCNGGEITIPVERAPAMPASQPCCAKGCRSGQKKRIDREQ